MKIYMRFLGRKWAENCLLGNLQTTLVTVVAMVITVTCGIPWLVTPRREILHVEVSPARRESDTLPTQRN
jgi:hypothetical protein